MMHNDFQHDHFDLPLSDSQKLGLINIHKRNIRPASAIALHLAV